jgi:hypothetical protein
MNEPAMAAGALRALLKFFGGDAATPFRADASLDEEYRTNILGWTGPGTGPGVAWHSRFHLDENSLALFRIEDAGDAKRACAHNRLRAAVDATWLATHVARVGAATGSQGAIPHRRDQLAGRHMDVASLETNNEQAA